MNETTIRRFIEGLIPDTTAISHDQSTEQCTQFITNSEQCHNAVHRKRKTNNTPEPSWNSSQHQSCAHRKRAAQRRQKISDHRHTDYDRHVPDLLNAPRQGSSLSQPPCPYPAREGPNNCTLAGDPQNRDNAQVPNFSIRSSWQKFGCSVS